MELNIVVLSAITMRPAIMKNILMVLKGPDTTAIICVRSKWFIFLLHLQYTLAMLGYGPEDKSTVMELTYNYGVTEYEKGNAYAQVRLDASDR